MRLIYRLIGISNIVVFLVSPNLFAESENRLMFSSTVLFGSTGQCPFSVTGGPQPTRQLRIDAYDDSDCTVFSNQFWYLDTGTGQAINLPSGTYSFSNNSFGQTTLCQQRPTANSFKIRQINTGGTIVSSSSCFTFTCNSLQINCTTTGTLALVDAS